MPLALSSRSPFPSVSFAPDPVGNLEQLAEKLKLSDPLVVEGRGDRDAEPDWLVHLRRRCEELAVSGVGAGPGAEASVSLFIPLEQSTDLGKSLTPRRAVKSPIIREMQAAPERGGSQPPSCCLSLGRRWFPGFACEALGPSCQSPLSVVREDTFMSMKAFISLLGTDHSGPVSLSCNVGQLLKRFPGLSFLS